MNPTIFTDKTRRRKYKFESDINPGFDKREFEIERQKAFNSNPRLPLRLFKSSSGRSRTTVSDDAAVHVENFDGAGRGKFIDVDADFNGLPNFLRFDKNARRIASERDEGERIIAPSWFALPNSINRTDGGRNSR